MKRLGIIRILVTFFLIQGASPIDADNAAIRLQLKLQEGDSYYMEIVDERTLFLPPSISSTYAHPIKRKTETAYEVQKVDRKGNMTIKVTDLSFLYDGAWDGMLYDAEIGDSPRPKAPISRVIYDSTNPPETDESIPSGLEPEAASVGQSITMIIAPNGKVKEVKGMEPIRARVEEIIDNFPLRNIPSGYEDKTKAIWKESSTRRATNEYAKGLLAIRLHVQIYPDHPVKVGDTWKGGQYSFGNSIFEYPFTLRDLRNGIAFIEEKSVASYGKDRYKHEGVIEIDEKTGWIQKMDLNSEQYSTDPTTGQTYLSRKTKFHMGPIAGR